MADLRGYLGRIMLNLRPRLFGLVAVHVGELME